jgi:hypothetical protein
MKKVWAKGRVDDSSPIRPNAHTPRRNYGGESNANRNDWFRAHGR